MDPLIPDWKMEAAIPDLSQAEQLSQFPSIPRDFIHILIKKVQRPTSFQLEDSPKVGRRNPGALFSFPSQRRSRRGGGALMRDGMEATCDGHLEVRAMACLT